MRALGVGLGVSVALALLGGCTCVSFPSDLDDYRCDGPGAACPAGRTCRATAEGEFFCVLSAEADGGGDGGVPDSGPIDSGPPCVCDDANPCNGLETCDPGGACVPGAPVDCSPFDDACNLGVCAPLTGACSAMPRTDGTSCDGGVFCTVAEVCTAGVCGAGSARSCGALDGPCVLGICDEMAGACATMARSLGWPCDDGILCTAGDQCTAGVCAGTPGLETGLGSAACGDFFDNDCDGATDAADPGCQTCAPSCATCTSGCCEEAGGGAETCPAGCACGYSCPCAGPLTATCNGSCAVDCAGESDDCSVTCNSGATCTVDCSATTGTCGGNCSPGAVCNFDCSNSNGFCQPGCDSGNCLLDCTNSNLACHFSSCPVLALVCGSPGTIYVCGPYSLCP